MSVDDFTFDGPLGCDGAAIEQVGENHFQIVPGHAPEQPGWANMVQFTILRNAKGNALRLDVVDEAATSYMFNDYFYSWSCDGESWNPVHWEVGRKEKVKRDTLVFPVFTEDTVYVGHQVPISYEELVTMVEKWGKRPHVTNHVIGQSLDKRNIYRLTVTDPDSPHAENARWVHYFGNQHPGEHNAQWRMAGIMDWLLSEPGADCRRRSICHFVFMTSPDAPSRGWYRVNGQGVDMNRSYRIEGADPESQAHEACVVQRDLETIMASAAPVTDLWSMHTWGGVVEPILLPGPEMTDDRPWTLLRGIMDRNDPEDLVLPLAAKESTDKDDMTQWTNGPHKQFGISTVLCEGAGNIYTKEENMASGVVIMKSLAEYYGGTKEAP